MMPGMGSASSLTEYGLPFFTNYISFITFDYFPCLSVICISFLVNSAL